MPNTATNMMKLIARTVTGVAADASCVADAAPEEILSLYNLAKKHDVAHLLGAAFEKCGLSEEIPAVAAAQKKTFSAVFRYEGLRYESERIYAALETARIPYLPLKGSVLRRDYPEAWMRTSCDIDILVRESDLDAAIAALATPLGFTFGARAAHDVSAYAPSGVHLELHFTLIEEDVLARADAPLVDVWEQSRPVGESFLYEMPDALFYYYHVAHMAKHFMNGGCGVRPFIDLWILRHKRDFDAQARAELLERGGLSAFATAAETLSEAWLGDGEHTELSRQMEQYVLFGGVYGSLSNRVSVQQSKKGGKFRYALSRIWLPYRTIAVYYPVLVKHKWLLPVCQVRRWFHLLFGGRFKSSVKELRTNSATSTDAQESTARFLANLGL